ncbi:MAG: hypothetical protein KDJ52_32905 [Anaerolineae bacterium]|nr:hypothetical protein [Anaerolineae bacterium]
MITGTALRVVTVPTTLLGYKLLAGFLLGAITMNWLAWAFLLCGPFWDRSQFPTNRIVFYPWKRLLCVVVTSALGISYVAFVDALMHQRYLQALGGIVLFFSLIVIIAGPADARALRMHGLGSYLGMTFLMATWGGVVPLIGSLFGLSLAIMMTGFDVVLPVLLPFWLLSGLVYGAVLGMLTGSNWYKA